MGIVACTAVMVATFVGVSLLRWPLLGVLLGIGSLACAWAYVQLTKQAKTERTSP
jgi:chromate transporter